MTNLIIYKGFLLPLLPCFLPAWGCFLFYPKTSNPSIFSFTDILSAVSSFISTSKYWHLHLVVAISVPLPTPAFLGQYQGESIFLEQFF